MDDLLKWITPDETAADFLIRQRREAIATGLPFIDSHVKLRPGHVVEIVGPTSSGKTEILIEVAANVLSRDARAQNSAEQGHVVVFDCDGKFDFIRFIQVLTACLPPTPNIGFNANGQSGADAVPDVFTALERFHTVRCSSSLELLLALTTLPREQATWQGPCRMILLDNIGAFVWQDRAAASTSSSSFAPQQQHHAAVDAQRFQGAVAALLRELSQRLRCPVVVSKQAGVSQDDRIDGSKLVQRELLTNAWQSVVTHRLLLLPTLGPNQALSTLIQGPKHTEVVAQWQGPGYFAPLTKFQITQQAIVQS